MTKLPALSGLPVISFCSAAARGIQRWRPMKLSFAAPALLAFALIAFAQDNPQERAALPEFKIIPAAKPEELTPAAKVDAESFTGWPRSQGDNGARRYSALKQITRENVKSL